MQQKPKICREKNAIAHALLTPHPRQGICRTACNGRGAMWGANRACTNFLVIRRGGRTCPPAGLVPHSRQGTRALPYKMLDCRAGPMCPAAHRTPCKNPVIAKPVTDVTGCGNPYCLKKAQRARSNPARCAELFIVKGKPVTSRCGCSAFPDSGKCWPPSCAAPWPRSSRSPSVKIRPCGPKSP